MAKRGLLLDDELYGWVKEAAQEQGFASGNALIRKALMEMRDRCGAKAEWEAAEERLAAEMVAIHDEVRRIDRMLKSLYSYTDSFGQMVLRMLAATMPEMSEAEREAAKAKSADLYRLLIERAAQTDAQVFEKEGVAELVEAASV